MTRSKDFDAGIRFACKAVCQWCKEVGPPEYDACGRWMHRFDEGVPRTTCFADNIMADVHAVLVGTRGWEPEDDDAET